MMRSFSWYDTTQTTFIINFENYWSVDDFHALVAKSCIMIRQADKPVYVIVDFTNCTTFPSNILSAAHDVLKDAPETIEHIIVVSGGRALICDVAKLFLKLYTHVSNNITLIATMAAALTWVEEEKNALPT